MKPHLGRSALILNAVIALATIATGIILPNIFSYIVIISGVLVLFTFIPDNNRRLGIIFSYMSLIASVCITSQLAWAMLQNPSPNITSILLYPLAISFLELAIGFIALIFWAGIPTSSQHELKQLKTIKMENKAK